MKTRTYTQRNRSVTSCSECVRRKQKCNRYQPCDICTRRRVPELCSFGRQDGRVFPTARSAQNESGDVFVEEESLDSQSLITRMGYTTEVDPHFTTTMQKFLALDDDMWTPRSASSTVGPAAKDRYCYLLSQIPNDKTMTEFVDLYFSEANWVLFVLEKVFFEKNYASWLELRATVWKDRSPEGLSRDLQYFPALLFQMMAVALQFMPPGSSLRRSLGLDDAPSVDALSRKYTSLGMEIMSLLGRHEPALTSIQHDLLRVQWLKNRGRGTDSWDILGLAIR